MTKYVIEVTQEDIDKGIGSGGYGDFCPVERAVFRTFQRPVCVGHDTFSFRDSYHDGLYPPHYELPNEAKEWIRKYGVPSTVENGMPITFEVEVND